jgi:hypothetical protein
MSVALPAALRHGNVAAYVNGRRVAAKRAGSGAGSRVRFTLRARGGRAIDWAVARP